MVQGFRYNLAYPDEKGLIDMAVQSTRGVVNFARQELGAGKVNGMGESQAGPALLESVLQDPEAVDGAVVLLHSIGATALKKGEFMRRMLRSGMQSDQFHSASSLIAGTAAYRAAEDALRTGERRGAQMDFVLNYSIPERLGSLTVEQPDRVWYMVTGEDDHVVTPAEQYAALPDGFKDRGHVIPGASHSTLASPAGARQIAFAAELWAHASLDSRH
jgi:hypothetical protein